MLCVDLSDALQDGRSKGSGVVVFETKDAAQNAIAQFNGAQMENRQITVREDRYV